MYSIGIEVVNLITGQRRKRKIFIEKEKRVAVLKLSFLSEHKRDYFKRRYRMKKKFILHFFSKCKK